MYSEPVRLTVDWLTNEMFEDAIVRKFSGGVEVEPSTPVDHMAAAIPPIADANLGD